MHYIEDKKSEFSKRTCVRLKNILKHVCNQIIFNINAQFILQNNKIIFSAFLLVILTFLNSVGNIEAGPINVSEPFNSEDPDQQESGIQDEGSASEETETPQNNCIERYKYVIILNYFFRIPICKKGCDRIMKIVNFGKGRTYGLVYDCTNES